MNWALIISISIVGISVVIGMVRGFSKTVLTLGSTIIAILLVWALMKPTLTLVEEKTEWQQELAGKIETERMQEWTEENCKEKVSAMALPGFFREECNSYIDAHPELTKKNAAGLYMAHYILGIITALALFIVIYILLWLFGKLLKLVNKVPGFKQVNGLLGAFLGFVIGFIILDALYLLLNLAASTTSFGATLMA